MDPAFGLVCPIFSQGSHVAEFSVRNEQFSQDPKKRFSTLRVAYRTTVQAFRSMMDG